MKNVCAAQSGLLDFTVLLLLSSSLHEPAFRSVCQRLPAGLHLLFYLICPVCGSHGHASSASALSWKPILVHHGAIKSSANSSIPILLHPILLMIRHTSTLFLCVSRTCSSLFPIGSVALFFHVQHFLRFSLLPARSLSAILGLLLLPGPRPGR